MSKKILFSLGAVVIFSIAIAVVYFWGLPKENEGVSADTQKVYHVGIFSGLAYFDDIIVGFKKQMTELGYVEGENITYDVQRGAAPVGNQEVLKKFVQDKVDLILVFPTEASLEAKEVTKGTNIPIISTSALMEGNGLIESVQHPGDNVTGVRLPVREIAAKRFEILHTLVPEAKRILVPYLKDYPTVAPSLEALRPIVTPLGITLIEAPFSSPPEVEAYFKTLSTKGDVGIDAVLFIAEPASIIPAFRDAILAFAEMHKIPVGGVGLSADDSGQIFSLMPESAGMGQLAAPLADKIFKGIPAGTIPVVTPDPVLEINNRVIEKLGLKVSETLLSTAKKIVH